VSRRRRSISNADPAAELRRRLITLDSRRGKREPFLTWALRVPEPKTGTLDFARFPFQRELYEQGGEPGDVVIKKATQLGVSAFALRFALYWVDQLGARRSTSSRTFVTLRTFLRRGWVRSLR
jgi:hypothetical protein